ncbi:MAG: umuD [Flaviaesturariibacter sp.]|nr:umuD [Flaviaesturariibacter sp.]
MDNNPYFLPSYGGTKTFSQEQIQTAQATGFGAAADDYAERGIDLNEQLIRNKAATFFMRVNSDAMEGMGIYKGDVVIVDRSLDAKNGKVIIAIIDNELMIRKLEVSGEKKRLVATKKLASLEVVGELKVWGVVTYVIHNM